MHQAGLIYKWYLEHLPRKDRCWTTSRIMQATTHVVNLDDMQGSFFVLGLGATMNFTFRKSSQRSCHVIVQAFCCQPDETMQCMFLCLSYSRLQCKQIMSQVPGIIFELLTCSVSGCVCAVLLICLEQCYHKYKLSKDKRVIKPFASQCHI